MLPVVLDCALWPILLAGKGTAAVRRLAMLDEAGCRHVTVFGPETDAPLREAAGTRFRAGLPSEEDVAAARLLLAAGLSAADRAAMAGLARRHRVLLHVEDDLPHCDFHMPAALRRGSLLLTASTGGASPALASRIRAWLGERFGPEWSERLERVARLRAELKSSGRNAELGPAVNALADREGWFDPPPGRAPVRIEEADPESEAARYCLAEYYAELEKRFEGGFEVGRSRAPQSAHMVRPRGAFLVAFAESRPIGCVILKGTGGEVAEIKRLWVAPSARGLGLAKRLMTAAETVARELAVKVLRLDTNRALPEALHFYRTAGWTEIARFNDDPYADHFFEKRL